MLVSRVVLKASGCFEDARRRILAFSTRTACSCVFHGKVHSQITVAIPNSHQNEQADSSANKQSEECECFPCVIFFPILFAAFRDITDISPVIPLSKDPMRPLPPGNSSWPDNVQAARRPWAYVHCSLLQALRPSLQRIKKWQSTYPYSGPKYGIFTNLHFAWCVWESSRIIYQFLPWESVVGTNE